MKKSLLLFVVFILISGYSIAQLTGTKTIPGTYATVALAIADINTAGVGTGGVTFNIAAGYTETFTSLTAGLITATGTSGNPIIFQKSGAGANPVITAATPGSGNYDYIFCIGGADYITFDGINVMENAANTTATMKMEYGFAIFKASATDGSQNNTIKNAVISLSNNSACYGIYSNNYAFSAPGTALTVTALSGANSLNKFYSLTFNSCYNGINLVGYADVTPFSFYDQDNEVGKDGANIFNGLANGGTTVGAIGLNVQYQNNIRLANNTFTGTAPLTTGSCYVFNLLAGTNSNVEVYNNTVSMTYTGTGVFGALYNSGMGSGGTSNTVNYYNNNIINNSIPNHANASVYFLYIVTGGVTANLYGNNVSNNNIGSTGAAATGPIYYMAMNSTPATAGTTNVYNNTISGNARIQSVQSLGTTYILYTPGTGNVINVYGNTINNIATTGSGATYGIYCAFSGTTKNVYNNTFTNITNVNGLIAPLYNNNGTNAYYYNNKFQNITLAGGIGPLYGLYSASGTNVHYYNNFVSEFKAPNSATTIYGMYINGGTSVKVYNNSIYLNAVSTGATFNVTGIRASTTPNVDLRNNIVVNNSVPMGAGRVIAYERTSTTLTSYANTSNNNDFFAGTPGASNLIFYDGTNSDQTLAAYQARVSPRDASSVTENPPFVNVSVSPYDLHLQTTVPTQCESGGATVATPISITTDFDGNPRFPNPGYPNNVTTPAIAPDLGADEFGGYILDVTPPKVVFTPLGNTSLTAPRTLTTTITDATGVATGTGLPRLFWKINSGAYASVTATPIGGNQYTFIFGTGAVLNDIISYYIVAQDIVVNPAPNIGASPSVGASGFTLNPPACSTPPTTPFSYIIVGTLSGVYPVGVGQVYPTVTAAVADLNLKEVVGPVTFELWDANYSASESFPLTINPYVGASSTNTVKFKPKTGVTSTITGLGNPGIIILNGCDYVTIDGSNAGSTDKNLTIQNTYSAGISAPIMWYNNGTGATNNTLKNCMIKGSSNTITTSYGIFLNSAGGFYDNTTIQNNTILSSYIGLQFVGVSGGTTTGGSVTQNIFGSTVDAESIGNMGINVTYVDGVSISNNTFQNFKQGTNPKGIVVGTGTMNAVINANNITGLVYTGTGGYGGKGIDINTGSLSSNLTITNNIISNLLGDGWNTISIDAIVGIRVLGITGGINLWFNSINLTGDATRTTATVSAGMYFAGTATGLNVRDNIVANSINNPGAVSKAYAIYSDAANTAFTAINYNDYFVSGAQGVLGYLTADQLTLTAWKTATTQDANSINIDPVFTSATNLIPTTALMNNAGIYLAPVPTDFAGTNRSNPPDIGAYDFSLDPLAITVAATAVGITGAILNGNFNANSTTMNTWFDYGLTTAYGSTTAGVPALVTGNTLMPAPATIAGLTLLTTYHFRARGVTTGGLIVYGNDFTFTTIAPPATVVTVAATAITSNGATLNGTVNANGSTTAVTFQYGLTTSYGSTAAGVPASVTGSTVTPVNTVITGLLPNTLYHFRAVVTSSGVPTNGADLTFTTGPGSAVVVTNPASNIITTTAQLNGTVTANSPSATVSFEWGLTTAYGNTIAGVPATVNGNVATASLATLSSLLTNTTYHYRCVAVNSAGTIYGLDQSFLTGCPAPAPAGTITGPVSVCQNGTSYVYSVGTIVNAVSYAWTLPTGGTITAGNGTNNITVSYSAVATSGNVTVAGVGMCVSGTPSSLAVTVNPMPTPVIAGPASVCASSTGNNYTTAAGFTTYTWTVSAGGTITSGQGTSSVNVTWNTVGAQTIGLTAISAAGCTGAVTAYPVTVNARPVPTIAGPTTMCAGTANNVYTTQAGMTGYVWTVSAGGTITAGGTSTSNSVTITWNTGGAQTVSVNYLNASGCLGSSPVVFNVTVNPRPVPTIGSSNTPCVGSTGNMYYTESGMTAYAWTVSAGGTIVSGQGTSAINVTWTGVGAQTVGVTYANANGCTPVAPSIYNLFVNPLPAAAGPVTGTSAVCAGTNGVAYSCVAILNATAYTWTLPAGATIASGAGTQNITVNFGASAVTGNITVAGNNTCGNGTASPAFPVTVNPLPAAAGTITGPALVCAGATAVAYSVPIITNATTYTWTVPSGATIVSGGTTRNIVVNFGNTAGSGVITVKGVNTCGNGAVSPNFNVAINAIPNAPVVTANGSVLTSSASTGNQWHYEGTAIAGATGQTYTVNNNTGYYWCIVTTNGCSSLISNKVWVVITGQQELQCSSFNVYPVPNDGRLTVSVTSPVQESYTIAIYNQVGAKIYELKDVQVNGTYEKQVDLRPIANGVYTVMFLNSEHRIMKKVMVNK